MRSGYDSVEGTVAGWRKIVPEPNPQVIGCYKNGRFANEGVARQAFPKARIVTYDVNGSRPDADVLDIEKGDASPATFPGWARKYTGKLDKPTGYASAALVSAVVSAMLDAGFKRNQFLIQSAHYTFKMHTCGPDSCGFPQADATQYADKGLHGQNTDLNLWKDYCFGMIAKPGPDPDARYGLFDDVKRSLIGNATERATVREYDKWRAQQTPTNHPHRVRLGVLRLRLGLLARRLDSVLASQQAPHPNQVWRRRELRERANGMRLV